MRKIVLYGITLTLLAPVMQSCFKSEPLNSECDIEAAYLSVSDPGSLFFNASDTLQRVPSDKHSIVFDVRLSADLSKLAPKFVLTPGATVNPPSGSVHDFSKGPVEYVVTSEDGGWHRTYSVSFKPTVRSTNEIQIYDFDHYYLDNTGKYYCWTDLNQLGDTLFNWSTANPGYALARGTAAAMEYPTIPVPGLDGNMAVQLVTRSTGPFGAMVNRRLAAGNIFIGQFDIAKALTETLKATRFGLPFAMKPLTLSGYYKYVPGEKYQDKSGATVDGVTDQGTIYSVLYRNHDDQGNPIVLYGDDVMTSPYLVALARLVIDGTHSDWEYFELNYTYFDEIDPLLLDSNDYSMSIVCSSSIDGDQYCGAVGSALTVDNLKVTCEKYDD